MTSSKGGKQNPLKKFKTLAISVIPLFNFRFRHHPDNPEHFISRGDYVGRDNLIDRLLGILRGTKLSRGAYLIAGFRGAGKTSVINWALQLYAGSSKPLAWLPETEINKKEYDDRKHQFLEAASNWKQEKNILLVWVGKAARALNWRLSENPIFAPLIHVRVNLGADQSLEPKDVLLTVALLLDKRIKHVESMWVRRIRRYLVAFFLLSILFYIFLSVFYYLLHVIYYLVNHYQAIILSSSILERSINFQLLEESYKESTNNRSLLFTYAESIMILLLSGWLSCRTFLSFPSIVKVQLRIRNLLRRITDAEESEKTISAETSVMFLSRFVHGNKTISPPLNFTQIESELLSILELARGCWLFLGRPDIIFVFDELDKISPPLNTSTKDDEKLESNSAPWAPRDVYHRKSAVDNLLAALKVFISEGHARFFFIAGREMLDSFQAERGSASALYESLFDSVLEVPSLLTDPLVKKDGRINRLIEVFICRRIIPPSVAVYHWYLNESERNPLLEEQIDKKGKKAIQYEPFKLNTIYHYIISTGISPSDARKQILTLRMFMSFLTLHSWGNPKRLMSLFEHFIKHWSNLSFDSQDILNNYYVLNNTKKQSDKKVLMHKVNSLKNTYFLHFGIVDQQRILIAAQVYVLFHQHLSRQFASIGDKQIVSALIALQFLIKFHRVAFSRSQLEYMGEALNIHRSPELNGVIDTLLSKVLLPDIRRIRNGLDRYRFTSGFEQEIRYISRVSDIESATFNFSLDATATVKHFFLLQLKRIRDDTNDPLLSRNRHSFPEIHLLLGGLFYLEQSYEQALIHYQSAIDYFSDRNPQNTSELIIFIEAQLKLGDTHERRQRYEKAAAAYLVASNYINIVLNNGKHPNVDELKKHLKKGDSKFDILKSPVWALWFLHIKRSPVPWRELDAISSGTNLLYAQDDVVFEYRKGQLAFFMSNTKVASKAFIKVIKLCKLDRTSRERVNYLGGTACLNFVETIITGWAQCINKKMWEKSINKRVSKNLMQDILTDYMESVDNLLDIKKRNPTKKFHSLTDFVNEVTNKPINEELLKSNGLAIIPPVTLDNTVLDEFMSCNNHEIDCLEWFKNMKLEKLIGLCLFAAIRFNQEGLHYHASVAYLKTLGICTVILSLLPVATGIPYLDRRTHFEKIKKSRYFATKLMSWSSQIMKLAFKSITTSNASGFVELIRSYGNRNVNEPTDTWIDEFGFVEDHPETAKFLKNYPHYSEEGRIELLFGNTQKRESASMNEPWCWLFSPVGERAVFFGIWSVMLTKRITKYTANGYPDFQIGYDQDDVGALSSRGMLFSHWLTGRKIAWKAINKLKTDNKIANSLGNNESGIWKDAARAIYNLDRANYYLRQLSGNNQEISIPSSLHIFFDMWELLYNLTSVFSNVSKLGDLHDNAKVISDNIEKNSHSIINPSHFNLKFVTGHTIKYAQDLEQLPDSSSRVRQNIIRNKYFLADDYEDPRFHLDWSLTHLFSPMATIIRLHVELSMQKLRNE